MNMRNECWSCTNLREVPGNAHIRCVNPDADMQGSAHGIRQGWFFYPMLFDPVWKEKDCANYDPKVSAVSDSVSQVA